MGKSIHFLKSDLTTSQNLATAALSYTTTYSRKFKLEGIYFKSSVNITETITITLDAAGGSNYDTVLKTIDLNGESSAVWIPEQEMNFHAGDAIKVQCTNANGTGTIYCTIKSSELP